MVSQIASREQIHYQIQVLSVLESVVHVDNEGVVELGENLPLIHDRLDTSFSYNTRLVHLFHGIGLLCFLSLNFPNFAKSSFTNTVKVVEVSLREGLMLRKVVRENKNGWG